MPKKLFIVFLFLAHIIPTLPIQNKTYPPPVLPNMFDGTCYFDSAVQLLLNTPPLVESLIKNKHLYQKTKLVAPFIDFAETFFKYPQTISRKVSAVQKSYKQLVHKYGAGSGGDPGQVIDTFIRELSSVARKNKDKKLYHKVFKDLIPTKYKNTQLFMIYITDNREEYRRNRWGFKFFKKPKGIIFIYRYVPESEDKKQSPLKLNDKNFLPLFKNYGVKESLPYRLIGFDIFDTNLPPDEKIAPGQEEFYYHSIAVIKSQYMPNNPWFFCDDNKERNIILQKEPSTKLGQHVTSAVYLPQKSPKKAITDLSSELLTLQTALLLS